MKLKDVLDALPAEKPAEPELGPASLAAAVVMLGLMYAGSALALGAWLGLAWVGFRWVAL